MDNGTHHCTMILSLPQRDFRLCGERERERLYYITGAVRSRYEREKRESKKTRMGRVPDEKVGIGIVADKHKKFWLKYSVYYSNSLGSAPALRCLALLSHFAAH